MQGWQHHGFEKIRDKDDFVIYGRSGIRKGIHLEGRCNFRNENFSCNAGYYHGYMTFKGVTIWHDYALKDFTLVTSDQSGFDIDYLVEVMSDITISSTTFEAATKKFNRFHNINLPFDPTFHYYGTSLSSIIVVVINHSSSMFIMLNVMQFLSN